MMLRTQLRKLIDSERIFEAPGAYDAITARIIEKAGFPAVYMTGYGTSACLLGMPDIQLITETEMVMNAKYIADAVNVPVVADADTGYGNALNVIRTVKDFLNTRVAAIQLEDQIIPKKCGHTEGVRIISLDEAVGKIKAACDTRDEIDRDFVIIARTDARVAVGGSLDDAIKRGNAFVKAGADMVFVVGPKSVEEMKLLAKKIDAPLMAEAVPGLPGLPFLTLDELQDMGYRMVIYFSLAMQVALKGVMDVMAALKNKGIQAIKDFGDRLLPIKELYDIAGFPEAAVLEKKYLPGEKE